MYPKTALPLFQAQFVHPCTNVFIGFVDPNRSLLLEPVEFSQCSDKAAHSTTMNWRSGLNKGRDFTPLHSAQVSSWAYPALFLMGTSCKVTKV